MRYPSIRVAILASLAYLGIWIGSSLVQTWADLSGDAALVSALSSREWTVLLPGLGFIGLMIMGMAQQFVPLYSGRELWNPRAALVQVSWAAAGVWLLLLGPSFELFGLGLWFAATVLFLFLILMTLRTQPLPVRPQGKRPEFMRMDRYGIPMTSAAVLYLIVASAGLFLASPSAAPVVPFAAENWFSFFHLYTLGFVTLMIFGVGFHLFPRFLDTPPRLALAKAILVLALPGPALVALTMPFLGDPAAGFVFALFAAVEATAAVLFAILVLDVWWRSERRRPSSAFNAVAGLWLVLGVGLATLFGIDPVHFLAWAPAHGWVNLLGFAGFEILGVTHEILPPFTSKGLRVSRGVTRADLVLAVVGLGLVVSSYDATLQGSTSLGDTMALAGFAILLVMVLLYACGTVWALFGIVRPKRVK